MKQDLIPTFSDGSYRGIINPGVVFDIEEDSSVGGWLDAARYMGGEKLISGEMGKFAGIRFVESTNATTFAAGGAGGVDIYSTFLFGPEAYAFGDWGTISAHFVAPGGKTDELAQVASVGWKGFLGATLIDEAGPRYLRIESSSGL
jgi:N4-gp56 family major capsid protein